MTHPGHEFVFAFAGRCVYEVAERSTRSVPATASYRRLRQPHRRATTPAAARHGFSSSSTPPTRSRPGWSATPAAGYKDDDPRIVKVHV